MLTGYVERWKPSPEPLLQLVIDHNDESMLREISEADYGMDADAHYAAIIHLITRRDFTACMEWEPSEVLELIRWSEPDDPHWKPGTTGDRGHWMRLFSCTLLLRSAAERENRDRFQGEVSTIIQLVASSMALGDEASRSALRFLCWRLQIEQAIVGDDPIIALGILLLAISLRDYDRERLELLMKNITPEWGYISGSLFGIRENTWRRLLESVVLNAPLNDIDFVKETVAEILAE